MKGTVVALGQIDGRLAAALMRDGRLDDFSFGRCLEQVTTAPVADRYCLMFGRSEQVGG